MKKSIFLFFAAILCNVSVWGYNLPAGYYVYFEKPSNWTNAALLIGHGSWSSVYNMTNIQNTGLYYVYTAKWDGYDQYYFIDAVNSGSSWGDEGSSPEHRKTYASNASNKNTGEIKKYHLFTTDGSKSSDASDKKVAINRTQTIKVKIQNGETWDDATTALASLSVSTYAMTTSSTSVGAVSTSIAKESATVSTTVDAAYSATVKLSCADDIKEGYVFLGWYDSNGNKISTSKSTSYKVAGKHTIHARFKKDVYYLAGTLVGAWQPNQQEMPKVSENIYEYTLTKPAGTYEFKVTDGTWNGKWDSYCIEGDYYNITGGNDNNIVLKLTEETTFTVRFNKSTEKVSFTGLKPATYTVAGDSEAAFGTKWDPTNTANDMALEGGLYKWTKTNVALYANTKISFKVVKNHDWNKGQWPERDGENDNNWILQDGITADGLYTITITFNESTKEIQATATKTGDIVIKDFSNQPATLYFHPSFHWTSDYAQFAAYFYNNGPGADAAPTWASMTDGDGDGIYEVTNAKKHEYVIICRMNPSRTENRWNQEGDEDAKKPVWNQIQDGITIPNAAGDLNTCLAFWTNCQGDVPTSECTWVAPTPLTDKNWDAFIAAYNGKTINAVVERSFNSGQNHTLCLPFNLPTNWLGDGSKAYQLNSIFANTAEELQLNASECNTIEAGKPYIIVPKKGYEYEHIIVSGVTVKEVAAGTNIATGDGYKATLKAVTTTGGQTNGSTEYYVGANDGYLYNAVVDKLGLRAIIELTTTSGQPLPARVRARVATKENTTTGLDNITNGENTVIKTIENGQLIIIRNGEKFNAQGVRL